MVGFGATRRRDITGAVAFIQANDLIGDNNIEAALNGRVAGLDIRQEANPGGPPQIRLRGAASLTGANQPLYVMNGIPVDKLNLNINPNDIDNITVLKDATATAIYGCRAANGVIMIESKTGS